MAAKPKAELQRDAERTRAELLTVATEVFAESGYSGARVDEIAERTRTTKRMIYYYFGGKEQLYLAVLEKAYRGIREAEQKLRVDHADPVGAIRRLAEVTFDHHIAHDAFIRLVVDREHPPRRIHPPAGLAARPVARRRPRCSTRYCATAAPPVCSATTSTHSTCTCVISSYCVFQVANQYTFGYLFDVDLTGRHSAPTCAE